MENENVTPVDFFSQRFLKYHKKAFAWEIAATFQGTL